MALMGFLPLPFMPLVIFFALTLVPLTIRLHQAHSVLDSDIRRPGQPLA